MNPSPEMTAARASRTWWLGVLLITCAGAALRLADLGGQSVWYDEAYSSRIASNSTAWELFTGQHRDSGNPPLYYIAHRWSAMLFGDSEAGQRMFAALCGVLTIPLLAGLARALASGIFRSSLPRDGGEGTEAARVEGNIVGLIAAALFAVSPLSVELSNEARTYSLVHLVVTLNALLFVRWLSSLNWRDGLFYMLTTGVACYLHYFVVFFIMAQGLAVIAAPQRGRAVWRWCVLMLGVAVMWAPWVPAFLAQVRTPGNLSRMGEAWKLQFASTPVVFAVGRTFAWREAGRVLLGLAGLIAVIGFCMPALIGWVKLLRTRWAEGVFLGGWIALPVLIPLAVALTLSPIYHHRYGSVGLPAFLCLVAIGLVWLPRSVRSVAVLAILLGTSYSLTNYYRQPLKDDWRGASEVLLADAGADRVLLTDQDSEVLPLLYYARRHQTVPPRLYGLNTGGKTPQKLSAVRYQDGTKQDADFVDYTAEILQSPRISLALCVPNQPLDTHRVFFEQHGYRLVHERTFYRITVADFERVPELSAKTP